jgi:putative transposase
MICVEDRRKMVAEVEAAHRAGARLGPACELVGIRARTIQRWKADSGLDRGDGRARAIHPLPGHALTQAEREQIVRVANQSRFSQLPPARIVPMLADEGIYIASESSFHRVLRAQGQLRHRGRARAPQKVRPPSTHIATAINQVWTWDMTFLPAEVLGRFFYLYLVLDLYSRKIIGWEVHETDSSDHAVDLVRRTALAEKIHSLPTKPVLHGDNGATLKATTVLAMLTWLGIRASYSRPRVSDDNAFSESLFRTVKYRPEFPAKGFATVEHARQWVRQFTSWYNHDHRHSGIRYVSPAQRHAGEDRAILAARHELYTQMKAANPRRWSGQTRNWTPIAAVTLNPERDSIVQATVHEEKKRSAA